MPVIVMSFKFQQRICTLKRWPCGRVPYLQSRDRCSNFGHVHQGLLGLPSLQDRLMSSTLCQMAHTGNFPLWERSGPPPTIFAGSWPIKRRWALTHHWQTLRGSWAGLKTYISDLKPCKKKNHKNSRSLEQNLKPRVTNSHCCQLSDVFYRLKFSCYSERF